MSSTPKINELIQKRLSGRSAVVQRICQEAIAGARYLPEKALEARLEELIRKAVKHGKDGK